MLRFIKVESRFDHKSPNQQCDCSIIEAELVEGEISP